MQASSNLPTSYGDKIYEGKAKIVYRAADNTLFHYFKDSATAFNAQKKAEFDGKGTTNLTISSLLFEYLAKNDVITHYLAKIDERTFQSLPLKMIPAEVVVRNKLAGSLAKRLGEKDGQALNPPVVEFYYKDDAKGDPLVSEDVLVSLYNQSWEDLRALRTIALRVNELLVSVFKQADLDLVDFKLEFGKDAKGRIVLGDEISPDTCRLWDLKSGEKMDKDRFRLDLGDLMTGYREVLERLKKVLRV